MRIRYALIMAAGRGMRMMPLTNEVPKAMAIYEGQTLIANGIERLTCIVPFLAITVGYKGAMLSKHVIEHNVSMIINTEGKGNSWWIFNSLFKFLNEPVVVLTCDNIVELDFKLLSDDYYTKGEPACMVVPVKPVIGLEGDFIHHTNKLVNKISRTDVSDIYCSGIQVINPYLINKLIQPVENFNLIWNNLIKKDNLYCSEIYPKKWISIDTLKQLKNFNGFKEDE